MTTISAYVVEDSISELGIRLTTLLLRYPRWIHAEGRTHRKLSIGEEDLELDVRTPSIMDDPNLSRNSSSSRAIPVYRLIEDVTNDPAVPMYWGANQRGMQAGDECNSLVMPGNRPFKKEWTREEAWLAARDEAISWARAFADAGYHKQIVNRLLEPFSHINVVVTATEWTNFFALRDHPDAEPHIRRLAKGMREAMALSTPKLLKPGEWHLPFVENWEIDAIGSAQGAIPLSVARCARTSYRTHQGKQPVMEEDLKLAKKLTSSVPLHASPAEHQATPDRQVWADDPSPDWENPALHGNLRGWVQYRKTLKGECQ